MDLVLMYACGTSTGISTGLAIGFVIDSLTSR